MFQGNAAGNFVAYRADNGQRLWSMPVQTGVVAAPMSYAVGGVQYIALLVGWGGAYVLPPGELSFKSGHLPNRSRLIVFKLNGTGQLPPAPPPQQQALNPPTAIADTQTVERGKAYYSRFCSVCHGDAAVSGGLVPDLRYSNYLGNEQWFDVVLNGALRDGGMAAFKDVLDHDQAAAIRAYVIARANQDAVPAAEPATQEPPQSGTPAPAAPAAGATPTPLSKRDAR